MLRGNYYCHLFQHTSWTTKTRHESHLEISNLLNVLSGMQFDSKRKFGGGVDCSTQKENKQTLYNNNRNNKMCATILLHDRHVASPGTSIFLPFCKGHLFLFPFHHTLQDYIKPVPSEFIIDALFSSFRCQSIFSVLSRILSIAIEMQTLLQFYVSTSCIVYWLLSVGKTQKNESNGYRYLKTSIFLRLGSSLFRTPRDHKGN